MEVSYKKLWKLLIDRGIKKGELSKMAGISSASITKMGNDGNVTADVLAKICVSLGCKMDDILEIVPEEDKIGK
ncbi:helix-turn-helix domain-containing protein [Eubacterium pyruvativorans]|uniref:helix-turn-helix domain-containing protein n=1 Tax=Eubacterium pyruvativorans TaxID=155865 RepID=UPI00087EE103|nr:helix-turn-helix transcriptional regulator [Eubacterium pyruvativorans]SDE75213.1 DNA-binding transcriptional regulator, XRE family [Eubacterium pyruvativorans]